jgi:hypothetical protein
MTVGKDKDNLGNTYEQEGDRQIGFNMYDDSDEESVEEGFTTQPVELVREGMNSVTKNPNTELYSEERMSIIGDIEEDEDVYNDSLHDVVKSHSAHLSRLTAIIDSLQSKINQLEEATIDGNKSISAKAVGIKTKKKNNGKKK